MNKIKQRTLREFLTCNNGCVAASDWTTGHGRWTRSKSVPAFAERMYIEQAVGLPGLSGNAARRLRRARPLVRFVVVITDRRAANKAVKS